MTTLGVEELKAQFDEVVRRAQEGELFVVTAEGRPRLQIAVAGLTEEELERRRRATYRALFGKEPKWRVHPDEMRVWINEGRKY